MELAGFVLKRKLGEGGMGEVWLANQLTMQRDVALKILSPKLVSDANFIRRFEHEIKIAGKLHHPNIITAFDAGHVQGLYYLASQYVDGMELGDRMKIDRIIPERDALRIVRDIACALDYAWSEFKILHRDIKPSNIMLDKKNRAMLMDMGISKSLIEDNAYTISGTVVGTPYYISPEQARGDKDVDFHSDIYSLGATLYHMVAGKFPFEGDSSLTIMTRHITDPLVSPKEHYEKLSDHVCKLIDKMMNKDQKQRQGSWRQVVKDVDLVLGGKDPMIGPGLSDVVFKSKPREEAVMPDKTAAMMAGPAVDKLHTPVNITINRPPSSPEVPAVTDLAEKSAISTAIKAVSSSPGNARVESKAKVVSSFPVNLILRFAAVLLLLLALVGIGFFLPRLKAGLNTPVLYGNGAVPGVTPEKE